MTQQSWDMYKIKVEEIAEHLQEFHSVLFNDRRSLSEDDFNSEHFPELISDMQDRDLIFENKYKRYEREHYLNEKGKERLNKVKVLLLRVLKFCEDNGIAIAKIYWYNENGDGEWRICKPTEEQLAFLKFKRWFASAEGYINKALLQEQMLSEPALDEMLQDFKDMVLSTQEEREKKREKKKKIIEIIAQ